MEKLFLKQKLMEKVIKLICQNILCIINVNSGILIVNLNFLHHTLVDKLNIR